MKQRLASRVHARFAWLDLPTVGWYRLDLVVGSARTSYEVQVITRHDLRLGLRDISFNGFKGYDDDTIRLNRQANFTVQ